MARTVFFLGVGSSKHLCNVVTCIKTHMTFRTNLKGASNSEMLIHLHQCILCYVPEHLHLKSSNLFYISDFVLASVWPISTQLPLATDWTVETRFFALVQTGPGAHPASFTIGRVQLKCDGTRWRTRREVKGKLANGVSSQYSSHYLGTWCTQHYYRWCAHLGCQ